MSLLESVVLLDVVQVVSSEGHGPVHLGGEHDTLEDSATDGDVRGEWALLVDVLTLDGGLGSLETCTQSVSLRHSFYLPSPIFL